MYCVMISTLVGATWSLEQPSGSMLPNLPEFGQMILVFERPAQTRDDVVGSIRFALTKTHLVVRHRALDRGVAEEEACHRPRREDRSLKPHRTQFIALTRRWGLPFPRVVVVVAIQRLFGGVYDPIRSVY